jgi:hypothetical protein
MTPKMPSKPTGRLLAAGMPNPRRHTMPEYELVSIPSVGSHPTLTARYNDAEALQAAFRRTVTNHYNQSGVTPFFSTTYAYCRIGFAHIAMHAAGSDQPLLWSDLPPAVERPGSQD